MSLKISFESDIKGFERVQKALEAQSKALNDNADAAERFNKAQAGATSGEDTSMKGMYSAKAFNDQIKNLTSSLDLLFSKRSGFSGFLSMFGEFGKEIKSLNADASINIFKTMGTSIDALKNNMRGTSEIMRTLRREIDEANAAGKGKEAAKKTSELHELSTRQLADSDMLQKLERSKMWRQPFGGIGEGPGGTGGFLGGTSLERLFGAAKQTMAIAAGVDQAVSVSQRYRDSAIRGEEMLFARDTNIAQAAMAGNIGRQFMTGRGIGEEGKFMMGGFFTDAKGDFDLDQSLRMTKTAFRKLWSPTRSFEELRAEEAERLSGLDKSKQFGMDQLATRSKSIVMDPRVAEIEMQYGRSSWEGYISGMSGRGLSQEESISSMKALADLGIADDVLATFKPELEMESAQRNLIRLNKNLAEHQKTGRSGGLQTSRSGGLQTGFTPSDRASLGRLGMKFPADAQEQAINDAIASQLAEIARLQAEADLVPKGSYADLSHLGKNPSELGMTERGQAEFRRRVQYGIDGGQAPGAAQESYLRDIGLGRVGMGITAQSPVAAIKMVTDFVQGIQEQLPGQTAPAWDLTGGMRSGLQALEGMQGGTVLSEMQQKQIAMGTQGMLGGEVGNAGTMMEMGSGHIFQRAGVKSFATQAYLQDLMKTDPAKAYRIAAKIGAGAGGKMTADDIEKEVNDLTEQTRKMQMEVLGVDEATQKAIDEEKGPSLLMYGVTGTTTGLLSTRESEAAYKGGRFTTKGPTDIETGAVPSTPLLGDTQTTQRSLIAAEAMSITKQVVDANRLIAESLGENMKNVMMSVVGDGLVKMGKQISDSIGKIPTSAAESSGGNVMFNIKSATPVTGGQASFDRTQYEKGAVQSAKDSGFFDPTQYEKDAVQSTKDSGLMSRVIK